jgi:peroxiredoxin Q/BCP
MIELLHQRSLRIAAVSAAVLAAVVAPMAAHAQQPAAAPAPVITVGAMAPDFELRGATRYGLLANPVRLSDYRGQTVVIAFFYKARTKG